MESYLPTSPVDFPSRESKGVAELTGTDLQSIRRWLYDLKPYIDEIAGGFEGRVPAANLPTLEELYAFECVSLTSQKWPVSR